MPSSAEAEYFAVSAAASNRPVRQFAVRRAAFVTASDRDKSKDHDRLGAYARP